MEHWQRFWHSVSVMVVSVMVEHPPRLVEAMMLGLSAFFFGIWLWVSSWPYLILYVSYLTGAIASIVARELTVPSAHTVQIRWVAALCWMAVWVGVSLNWVKGTG